MNEFDIVSISKHDWSLNQQGSRDAARHDEKVKEAIQGNLDSIVSDGSIITADPTSKRIVKIPMRALNLPRIIYKNDEGGVGNGEGGEKEGDTIDSESQSGQGAGDQPGVEYYETEISIAELEAMIFKDLGLPHLLPKKDQDVISEKPTFDTVAKRKTPSNLDLQRTVYANITRNATESGKAEIGDIIPEDFRVRTYQEKQREQAKAVIIPMRDISGSMGDFEIYASRAFCWWAVKFLRTKYPKVDIVFLAHDTEAYEVDEEKFFKRGAGGGTKCSSANIAALDIIKKRYPVDSYNIYPMHFSDGDNWGDSDTSASTKAVQEMLKIPVNLYTYIQVGYDTSGGLIGEYRRSISNPRFYAGTISRREDVWPNLQAVFDPTKTLVA
ncbi:MAG: DUF444 family protein [Microgenomates group bacterium]|jgi:hypothetical protein